MKNPFFAASHSGVDYFHCTAEDRIRAAEKFDIAQCCIVLDHMPDVQKTVRSAVEKRFQKLDYDRVMNSSNLPIICSKRGCTWQGWEHDLKGIPDPEHPNWTNNVCPNCGSDSYYKMTQREFTKFKAAQS